MTDQLKQLSEAATEEAKFLIQKSGAYYRPNSRGYTNSAIQAGRYTLNEAISITHPNGPAGPRDNMRFFHEDDVVCEDWKAYRALKSQLTEAKAREAVAYEVAAEICDREWNAEKLSVETRMFPIRTNADFIADEIRTLAPQDATDALEQIRQQADKAGFERALNAAAAVGYCECAETRHVTLGDKVSQAIVGIEYTSATLSEPKDTPQ